MTKIAASIVILAGAIVFSAGLIAEALKNYTGSGGLFVGVILLLFGGAIFTASLAKPWWDSIPVNGKEKEET